jgi:DNA-binding transcriptional regulator YhcF (GntR family)
MLVDLEPADGKDAAGVAMNNRLLQLYETINAWRLLHGYAPTVRELAWACGLTHNRTWRGLCEMRERGLIDSREGKARTLRVTNG